MNKEQKIEYLKSKGWVLDSRTGRVHMQCRVTAMTPHGWYSATVDDAVLSEQRYDDAEQFLALRVSV